ncbi:MAG: DinB family protein [Flavobacteriales bacterium]
MTSIPDQLRTSAIKHLNEGRDRLHKCLGMLSEEQVWRRANANTASVGNLVLHLCGNVGQWVNSTLGREADDRTRDAEFSDTGSLDKSHLLARLDATMAKATAIIAALPDADLARTFKVQIYKETGVGIIVHVTEHFSYHVGQVTLHTKLLLDVDTGFYAGQDLNAKP